MFISVKTIVLNRPFALFTEDFKRYDSGPTQHFDEVGNDLQLNTVFQALLIFKAMAFHGEETARRPRLDYSSNKFICTIFNLRTITTPVDDGGAPAQRRDRPHHDHPSSAATTWRRTAQSRSCTTWPRRRGSRSNRTTTKLVTARSQHRHFLDTLVIVDRERKNSISPVCAIDKTKRATKDMLIFFHLKANGGRAHLGRDRLVECSRGTSDGSSPIGARAAIFALGHIFCFKCLSYVFVLEH
jgi:hypothetical protein